MIQVLNMIYGGERFSWDGHQLADKGDHLPGFLLDKSGILKASGAEISGHIEAKSGSFAGTLKAAEGVFIGTLQAANGRFEGELSCDSLQVVTDPNSMRRFPTAGYFPIGTNIAVIRSEVSNFLGISSQQFSFIVDDGQYLGHNITSIEFPRIAANRIIINFKQGNFIRSEELNGSIYSGVILWFQIGNGLKKIRLVDLPLNPGAGAPGTVYRVPDGSGTYDLKVKG